MYNAPDFVKVKINVREPFAAYDGCPMDQYGNWTHTVPCEDTPEYSFNGNTFVGLGLAHQCYSTLNP